jgi:hypothetical protein
MLTKMETDIQGEQKKKTKRDSDKKMKGRTGVEPVTSGRLLW